MRSQWSMELTDTDIGTVNSRGRKTTEMQLMEERQGGRGEAGVVNSTVGGTSELRLAWWWDPYR